MSSKSNNNGRAYEFAFAKELKSHFGKLAEIEKNNAFFSAQKAWNLVDSELQKDLKNGAKTAVKKLSDLEPLLFEPQEKILISFQSDKEGEIGDVRDVLVAQKSINWEIGFSLKNNHFAVKHSRLSKDLDFASRWFGVPCSQNYFSKTQIIFSFLQKLKEKGALWRDVKDKEENVYLPILWAFQDEILQISKSDKHLPQKLVEYLLGKFDFYKIINLNARKITQIQSYNLHGQLAKPAKNQTAKIIIPRVALPKRIVNFALKPGSKTTLEMYLDGGWQFTFRIHNASTKVEPSLKFDIQAVGLPASIICINCPWE